MDLRMESGNYGYHSVIRSPASSLVSTCKIIPRSPNPKAALKAKDLCDMTLILDFNRSIFPLRTRTVAENLVGTLCTNLRKYDRVGDPIIFDGEPWALAIFTYDYDGSVCIHCCTAAREIPGFKRCASK